MATYETCRISLFFFTMLHDYESVFMGHFEKLNKCLLNYYRMKKNC